jgi:hypothetical protein
MVVFDPGTGPALYVGGCFDDAGGVSTINIAWWNGTNWAGLPGGPTGAIGTSQVGALVVFDDGTGPALYVGGNFLVAGGAPASNIARWNGLTWSPLGSGTDGAVLSLCVFDDGTGPALYAGGRFTIAGGVSANRIARWDGQSWSPLGSGVDYPGYCCPRIFDLEVFDDGTGPGLHASGTFNQAGGVAVNNSARWDGIGWSPLGAGTNQGAIALAVYDDGSGPALFAAGDMTLAGTVAINNIARWDGVTWAPLGSGLSPLVYGLGVFDDGTGPGLYACGGFSTAGGASANQVARWDGSSWSALGIGLAGPLANGAMALTVFDDGTGPGLYVGGDCLNAGGMTANGIARWSCGSTISLSASQPGTPAGNVWFSNSNLTPGTEYFNVFSLDLCPAGPSTGPYGGLCITTPGNLQFIVDQVLQPLGTPLFHFLAPSSYVNWGPFALPPVTVDAVCLALAGGSLGTISPAKRITIQ